MYDLTDQTFLTYSSILNFTTNCRTNFLNTNYGASNLLVKQDASGRTIGVADTGTTSHTNTGHIDTQFLPNLDSYTITDTVTGELQDFGTNIIPDSNFEGNDFWRITDNWVIGNGVATNDGLGEGWLYLTNILTLHTDYLVTFDIVEYTSGAVRFWSNSNSFGELRSGVGTYSEIIPSTSTTTNRPYLIGTSCIGAVTNVYMEELTTTTQRTETRVLTHDSVEGNNYYIDTVLQDITTPLPDPTTVLLLESTTAIGYPDTLDSRGNTSVIAAVVIP